MAMSWAGMARARDETAPAVASATTPQAFVRASWASTALCASIRPSSPKRLRLVYVLLRFGTTGFRASVARRRVPLESAG